jgi:hypothetical protein
MTLRMRRIALPLALVFLSSALSAQEGRGNALVIGGAGQLGMLFEASDRLAIRPDLSYVRGSSNSSFGSGSSWDLVVGLATLHYLSREDRLRTYWTPRVSIAFEGSAPSIDGEQDSYTVSVALGARGNVTDRFSLFGEVGPELDYRETSATLGGNTFTSTSRQWSIANRVGVNLRF